MVSKTITFALTNFYWLIARLGYTLISAHKKRYLGDMGIVPQWVMVISYTNICNISKSNLYQGGHILAMRLFLIYSSIYSFTVYNSLGKCHCTWTGESNMFLEKDEVEVEVSHLSQRVNNCIPKDFPLLRWVFSVGPRVGIDRH